MIVHCGKLSCAVFQIIIHEIFTKHAAELSIKVMMTLIIVKRRIMMMLVMMIVTIYNVSRVFIKVMMKMSSWWSLIW